MIVVSLSFLCAVQPARTQNSTVDWWPMFHHDRTLSGCSDSPAPLTNQTLWIDPLDLPNGDCESAPTVVNGLVYVGSNDDNIYALDAATGAVVWKFLTGQPCESSPAVVDGVVYVGSIDQNVYALNATTGTSIWVYQQVNK